MATLHLSFFSQIDNVAATTKSVSWVSSNYPYKAHMVMD